MCLIMNIRVGVRIRMGIEVDMNMSSSMNTTCCDYHGGEPERHNHVYNDNCCCQ